VDDERKLRALVSSKPRTKAFKVELNAHVAELLIGPGAVRLQEIEAATRRRFFLVGKAGVGHEHFTVLDEGTLEKLAPTGAPVTEGQTVQLKLVEVGRHDAGSAVGKVDGFAVAVGGAARLVGKNVSAHVERVLDGVAYATLTGVEARGAAEAPITAEAQAEKPTRASRAKKPDEAAPAPEVEAEPAVEAVAEEPEAGESATPDDSAEIAPKKKKTRRGSRGGRGRKKKPAGQPEAASPIEEGVDPVDAPQPATEPAATEKKQPRRGSRGGRGRKKPSTVAEANGQPETPAAEPAAPIIHVPSAGAAEEAVAVNGDEPAAPKKKTRRGSRGGRRRRKPAAAASGEAGSPPAPDAGSDQA
jgi:predicted RNA-binding protein with TRAM domain